MIADRVPPCFAGAKKQMKRDIGTFVTLVLSHLTDAHQRVRHAAITSLALISETFSEDSPKAYKTM